MDSTQFDRAWVASELAKLLSLEQSSVIAAKARGRITSPAGVCRPLS